MNATRAKEQFSAYREGTLDAALRMAFERALATDAQLQAEYRAFERSLDDLDFLKEEEIEVPVWLSDRVATRLEEAQSQRGKSPIWWSGWFRNLAYGGLAVAVIGGGIVGVFSRGGGDQATGNVIGIPSVAPRLEYRIVDGSVLVSANTTAVATSGDVSSRFGNGVKGELRNTNRTPALFSLSVEGKETELVALPGSDAMPSRDRRAEGTLSDFAKTLATASGKPVRIPSESKDVRVAWDISGADVQKAANESLSLVNLSADDRAGIIVVSQS